MERPPAPLNADDRVLIVRLGALGDVLRALPAVRALRRAFPRARLSWVVEDLSRPILEGHPDLDEVLRFPRPELRGFARRPLACIRALSGFGTRLREGAFSVVLDLQSSLKSGIVTALSGAPRRIGFSPPHCRELSFLFTNEWVPLASPWLNRVDRNLAAAAALGAPVAGGAAPPADAPALPEKPEEGTEAEDLLRALLPEDRPVVVLSPGASRRQAYKMWPARHYARLATLLRDEIGVRPLVVWGPGEEALAQRVVRGAAGKACALAPPIGLRLLAAVLRRAALFVGADTGPMHLAWTVGCPVVALFGPTDPRLNAPRGTDDVVLRSGDGRMESIAPDRVLGAARRVLAGAAR